MSARRRWPNGKAGIAAAVIASVAQAQVPATPVAPQSPPAAEQRDPSSINVAPPPATLPSTQPAAQSATPPALPRPPQEADTGDNADEQDDDRPRGSGEHRVVRGDTLWDITQRYLGSPWYWPKVWADNPQVANPNWIYPGNIIRFLPGGDQGPTQVASAQVLPPSGEIGEGSLETLETPVVEDSREFVVAGIIGYRPDPRRGARLNVPSFVTVGELQTSGKIVGSFAESYLLSLTQSFYAKFSTTPKMGTLYPILRLGDKVIDPITQKQLGTVALVLGHARVTRLDATGIAVMEIVKQQDEIRRGDVLGPAGESNVRFLTKTPAEKTITGVRVVQTVPEKITQIAEYMYTIMNRGSADGVKLGNTFTIWRRHDTSSPEVFINPTLQDRGLPIEDIGSCVAVDVRTTTTICIVTRSLRPFVSGDAATIYASRSPN